MNDSMATTAKKSTYGVGEGGRFVHVLAVVLLLLQTRLYTSDAALFHSHPYVSPLRVEESEFDGKIIIVGGGAAGMFAAYTLQFLGIDFTLLEADSDIGGRAKELVGFVDVPLDLGAEWIHVEPRVRQELLLFNDTVDDEVIVYQPQTIACYKRKLRRLDFVRFFYKEYKFFNTTWHSYLTDYVYPYISNQTELNTPVETIDYSLEDKITVRAQDGRTFEGDRVIVATPVKILQEGDIQFIPELPSKKKKFIDKVSIPPILKAWVEFDERFYPDSTVLNGLIRQNKLYLDALFRKPSDRNVLVLFEIGKTAQDRVTMDDDGIFQSIMEELDQIFDGKASQHYLQHYIQNWSAEPFIKGSYSSNWYHMKPILEPVGNNRVYFCGEYLEREHRATVHGAGISGRNVAQQVLLDAA